MKTYDFGFSVILILLLAGGAFYGMNKLSDGQLERDAKGAVTEIKKEVKEAVK